MLLPPACFGVPPVRAGVLCGWSCHAAGVKGPPQHPLGRRRWSQASEPSLLTEATSWDVDQLHTVGAGVGWQVRPGVGGTGV